MITTRFVLGCDRRSGKYGASDTDGSALDSLAGWYPSNETGALLVRAVKVDVATQLTQERARAMQAKPRTFEPPGAPARLKKIKPSRRYDARSGISHAELHELVICAACGHGDRSSSMVHGIREQVADDVDDRGVGSTYGQSGSDVQVHTRAFGPGNFDDWLQQLPKIQIEQLVRASIIVF